jgi:hypothetical protein
VLLAFAVPYYLLIGSFQVKFARYTLPLLPPLCLWIGAAIAEWCSSHRPLPRVRRWPTVARACTALVGASTLMFAVALDGVMLRPDTRTAAAEWVSSHTGPATTVALASPPWFYTPPLTPTIGLTHILSTFGTPASLPDRYPVVAPGQGLLSAEALTDRRPDLVILSEFENRDALRAARVTGQENEMSALQRSLERDYAIAQTFQSRPAIGPFSWFGHRAPPHDVMYIMPTVRVYERRTDTTRRSERG